MDDQGIHPALAWLRKPKQYCAFVGSHFMFQHTPDRAAKLTSWKRVVVVAARHHRHEVWLQLDGRSAGVGCWWVPVTKET